MLKTGEVHVREESLEFVIEWKISDFWGLLDKWYFSPSFSFADTSWHLRVCPNVKYIFEWIEVFLVNETSDVPITFECTPGLKTVNKDVHILRKSAINLKRLGSYKISFRKSVILRRLSELLPFGILTVVCRLKYPDQFKATATEKLLNDLKSMMLSGDYSDTVIYVKGEEFRLHRNVLASRNPYFQSMFESDMKEKNTGIVTIDDCEPDLFRSFIHFVYTGKVDELTPENVCDLYELADKYQEDQLKRECLLFMMSTMSIDSFCDFTVLAFRHGEKELLKNARKFFTIKMKEIIRSVKWQTLITEYPIQANELHIISSEEVGT